MAYQDPKVVDPSPYEKMGAFYLGRTVDHATGAVEAAPVLYDSKDLTTHAVCVGMTGSGKTGLCLSLLEEAAIDGIPAIAIDPKGDIGNLLLGFPNLEPGDFEPWIDPGEATRKGVTVAERASQTANLWRKGLADWAQDGRRIKRLQQAADIALYTPGSNAGIPVSLLRSFSAPPPELVEDGDAFRERISAAVSGLLSLLGVDADPVRSREHILLSNILDHHWRAGRGVAIADLIREIQQPPFDKIGVMDLETVYPAPDRLGLSMTLNNLLASPGFSAWLEGAPLDIAKLLWTETGKPRIAVLSIAHLSEAERMFFVTILLNEVVAWMRGQSGTSSLRALVYMDEVFGYLPPTANPPSKKPFLTLLKQARAYGVGTVLATQNPVDLDYKGLSNTGTWFIGRLQTERDKLRVLDGLEGASAASGVAFDRRRMETILSGLSSRVFLMNNVHEDAPLLFHTRWALSYLRGPLTRDQIKRLVADRAATVSQTTAAAPAPKPMRVTPQPVADPAQPAARPLVPQGIEEAFLPVSDGGSGDATLVYRPMLHGVADLHYIAARLDIDQWRRVLCLTPLDDEASADIWRDGQVIVGDEMFLESLPAEDASFAALPAAASNAKRYASWQKALKTHVYRDCGLQLWTAEALKVTSRPGEDRAAAMVRVREAMHEKRDLALEKLRKRYAPKLKRIEDKIRAAEARLEREKSQYSGQKFQTAISIGATVLGALFGRKAASVGTVGRAGTAARGAGRVIRERQDVKRAEEQIAYLNQQLVALSDQFEMETDKLRNAVDPDAIELTEKIIRPRKSDIGVQPVRLVWAPYRRDESGFATPAYDLETD